VVAYLQTALSDTWVLYASYKHYHWQLYGPLFRDLHLMFDEFADGVFDTIDDLDERMRRLGANIANTQLWEFQEASSVTSAQGTETVEEMIAEARANLLRLIPPMRSAVTTSDDAGDPGTVDLLSKIVQVHEKNEWFLRQILMKQDRLVT
jgi:starvation-inducible DNA-binding protein